MNGSSARRAFDYMASSFDSENTAEEDANFLARGESAFLKWRIDYEEAIRLEANRLEIARMAKALQNT